MIYLAVSIACSTLIVLIFKSFQHYRIDAFQAIVVNYLTCFAIGLTTIAPSELGRLHHWSGFGWALLLGSLFIILFYLIARTTQLIGVTVASVAQKLSFVIPVVAGIALFHEALTAVKIIGFATSVLAVVFISKRRQAISVEGLWWLPLIVCVGSGICDLIIKVVETFHLDSVGRTTFTVVLFGTAFVLGLLWVLIRWASGVVRPDLRSLGAGVLLGVPNYGSIYFLLAALQQSGLESSQVFPINNVGIILLSALSAAVIFREYLNRLQLIGLVLALGSILLLV